MKPRLIAGLTFVLAGVFIWLVTSRQQPGAIIPAVQKVSPSAAATKVRGNLAATSNRDSEVTQETTPAADLKESVPAPTKPQSLAAAAEPPEGPEIAPGLTPVTVLENMRAVFRQYSLRFGGNPTGINREITAALNGSNSKQVVFLDTADGIRVNARGELIDNWGTPYFFHQLSRTEMEIHSAGPDLKMWSEDDLVIK